MIHKKLKLQVIICYQLMYDILEGIWDIANGVINSYIVKGKIAIIDGVVGWDGVLKPYENLSEIDVDQKY